MKKIIESISNKIVEIAEKSVDMSPEIYSVWFFGYEITLEENNEEM